MQGEASTQIPTWLDEANQALQAKQCDSAQSVVELRESALAIFRSKGLPTPKDEEWRYTPLGVLRNLTGSLVCHSREEVTESDLTPYVFGEGVKLVIVNGKLDPSLSSTEGLPDGVTLNLLQDGDAQLISQVGTIGKMDEHPLLALNTAFIGNGVVLQVSDGIKVDIPISVVFVVNCSEDGALAPTRLLIDLGKGASATVTEHYVGLSATSYNTLAATEVVVEEGGNLNHIKITEESEGASHFSSIDVIQREGSEYSTSSYNLRGNLIRNDVRPVLDGEEIFSEMLGLSILEEDEHVDNCTVLDHALPNSRSNELYKGVYGGKSKGIFNGTIIVREGAQKTNAIQSNQSLLLSDSATSNAMPRLKIWADDVRCTHGATTGEIDQDALFYLRSRGIPEKEARSILVHAFTDEVLGSVEDEGISAYLRTKIDTKLNRIL